MDEPLIYIQEQAPVPLLPAPKWWHRISSTYIKIIAIGFFVIGLSVLGFFSSVPAQFPINTVFSVAKGETLSGAALSLEKEGVIKSPFLFKVFISLFAGTKGLSAGDYYLSTKQGVVSIAWRLSRAQYDLENIKVTIPEGFSTEEIAVRMKSKFNSFNTKEFVKLASPYEGYLFPDTYLFLPNISAGDVVKAMTDNYQKKIKEIAPQIIAFKKPIKDIISMASIIEKEARTEESRRMIAGILWKRLSIGMPLQVDAAFAFVNGKTVSSDLTLDDLKIDSPYNTYIHKGLPPGPISNPGLDSIKATISPIKSEYFFYLSDKNGVMHYAVTHDEHLMNKEKYLR